MPPTSAIRSCRKNSPRKLAERPLQRHFTISDQELDEYREKYRPARKRALNPRSAELLDLDFHSSLSRDSV